ncbi:MAG: xanthine dehydrogenase family protein molybdopterin-binding subunit [Christensenella sp.]|nr:xanthine dehydrogenase family protein molybdopterin-binding subunit [Christensenella sp.]
MPLFGRKTDFTVLNQSKPRIDGVDKVTGRTRYAADLSLPGMLYGGMLRSGLASARVKSIDVSAARSLPGVHAVVTAADLKEPRSWAGYMYLTDTVRYQGDTVALVAAESRELVQDALEAISVEYEPLDAVFDIRSAMKPGAHAVHAAYPDNIFTQSTYRIQKGDVESAFARADLIVEREYETQYAEHAYIEPEAVLAYDNPNEGGMTVLSSSQNPFFTRRYVADILQTSMNRVQVIQQTLGGSFGGKEEGVGLAAARAAYLARLTGHPVKIVFTREESFLESAKRHPFLLRYKAGLTKEGRIIAWQGTQIDNCGAYNNQTQFMNWRANVHSAGAYAIDNIKTETFGVFTNNIHGGAFRGYSSPQLIWGQEQFIDECAEALGMRETDFRRINCLKDGLSNATGTTLEHVTLPEVMEYTLRQTDYEAKRDANNQQTGTEYRRGIGMAISHRSCGFGAEAPDASGAMLIANEDGSVYLNTGLAENGQGLKTAYAMIVAESLGVCYEAVSFYGTNTHSIPDCGMTVASRGTVMGAQSVRLAGLKLNAIMRQNAIDLGFFGDTGKIESACGLPVGSLRNLLVSDPDQIVLKQSEFYLPEYPAYRVPFGAVTGSGLWAGKQMSAFEWFTPPPCIQDHRTGQGTAAPTYAYGCVVAEVRVDMRTGYVDVVRVTSSHDVGTAVNPALIQGQIYGGIVMGQGYGTCEDMEPVKGICVNKNLDGYIIPTAMDIPDMKIHLFECDDPAGTYGAKSVGEPATEAVAAAIANAIANATGRRIRENPATLEQVLLGKKLR